MAFIGIGYSGDNPGFLKLFFDREKQWILAERKPRFFGDSFVVMFDSNTTREVVKKLQSEVDAQSLAVFVMSGQLRRSGRRVNDIQ